MYNKYCLYWGVHSDLRNFANSGNFTKIQQIPTHLTNLASDNNPAGEPDATVIYPPNGIIPFHGFSFYLAPICFVW